MTRLGAVLKVDDNLRPLRGEDEEFIDAPSVVVMEFGGTIFMGISLISVESMVACTQPIWKTKY